MTSARASEATQAIKVRSRIADGLNNIWQERNAANTTAQSDADQRENQDSFRKGVWSVVHKNVVHKNVEGVGAKKKKEGDREQK
jgi:hypothetical protein